MLPGDCFDLLCVSLDGTCGVTRVRRMLGCVVWEGSNKKLLFFSFTFGAPDEGGAIADNFNNPAPDNNFDNQQQSELRGGDDSDLGDLAL